MDYRVMDYSYRDAVREDVRDYILYNYIGGDPEGDGHNFRELAADRAGFEIMLYDELRNDDGVTGNASGSYTCNASKAHIYIDGDPDAEDIIRELIAEWCLSAETIAEHLFDWEYWDVSIRLYLLRTAIHEAVDELLESY